MEAVLRRARECHQFCPASHDWEMIRAKPQNRRRLQATTRSSSGTQSGTEDSVHLAADVLVGDGFALIEGDKTLADLLPKPFVMVKVARNQLAHDLVRSFARLRGDPV